MRQLPCIINWGKWDHRFYGLAREAATWSKDPSRRVGAALVSPDKRRFSLGYNGFPVGVEDTAERLNGDQRLRLTAHAELNCILNAGCDLAGWTLYVTRHPCHECAKAIIQARVVRVVCPGYDGGKWESSCATARALFAEAGVQMDQIKWKDES